MKTTQLQMTATMQLSGKDVLAFVPVKKRSGRKQLVTRKPRKSGTTKPAHRKKDTLFPALSPDGDADSGNEQPIGKESNAASEMEHFGAAF